MNRRGRERVNSLENKVPLSFKKIFFLILSKTGSRDQNIFLFNIILNDFITLMILNNITHLLRLSTVKFDHIGMI